MTRRQLETVVGFFRSLRELSPPDVDLGELGALLDPLPEVVPGSSTSNSGGVNSINKSASMSSTKSDDSNNSDGQQQQQHKSKKQALASRLSNVAREVLISSYYVSLCDQVFQFCYFILIFTLIFRCLNNNSHDDPSHFANFNATTPKDAYRDP